MSTTRTWTIEVDWFCGSCGTRNPGMKGRERESLKCVTCGHEKTSADREAELDPTRVLTGELDAEARRGPTWTCSFCGKESRGRRKKCEVCGSARQPYTGKGWITEVPLPPPPEVVLEPPPPPPAPPQRPMRASTPPGEPGTPRRVVEALHYPVERPQWDDIEVDLPLRPDVPWVPIGVGTMVLATVIALGVLLCAPREASVVVSALQWRRTVTVEERHEFEGAGWRDAAPRGVLVWHRCEERQDGTHDCNPHSCNCRNESYECGCTGGDSYSCNCRPACRASCTSNRNGSGTCTERCTEQCSTCTRPRVCRTCTREVCSTCYDQCPTMRTWCTYRYERWDLFRTMTAAGSGTEGIRWPTLEAQGPDQRAALTEAYTATYREVGGTDSWIRDIPLSRYTTHRVGQRFRASYTLAGDFSLVRPETP